MEVSGHHRAPDALCPWKDRGVYGVYGVYDVYGVYGVYDVYGVYGVYGVYDIYCVYGIYGVHVVYGVYGVYGIKSWMGPGTGVDVLEKIKLSCRCRDSKTRILQFLA
jgi:hypothetical protein